MTEICLNYAAVSQLYYRGKYAPSFLGTSIKPLTLVGYIQGASKFAVCYLCMICLLLYMYWWVDA